MKDSYNLEETEVRCRELWGNLNVFCWDPNESRENTFVVDVPPPTVSGELHMGHMYSYTQADFIVRFQRMLGKNIFCSMGFDDNGLPTERLVEKQKGIRAKDMDRSAFIQICQEVVLAEEAKFRSLFNSIAISVDWKLEYQTISENSRKISQMSFLDLVKKNQIYRAQQPILWDPVDQTALAQADIEDKAKTTFMNDIIFKTEDGKDIHIATTRPELLPACVAVFYNPDDERYKNLAGQNAIVPLFGMKVPILPDSLVKQDKGTGLVMCCTFGDFTDILWWQKYKLPLKIIITKHGTIESDNAGELFGLKVNAARTKVLELLKESGLLVKQVEITHNVKCAERSGAPLEILTEFQWFVRTIDHKEQLLQKAKEINWHPKSMKIRLDTWINGIAWDWCISRQRYFGVPFPVWYSKRPGEEGRPIFADISQLPIDPLKDLPMGYTKDEVEPDLDVMDTWATSSVSPQLNTLGISDEFAIDTERHKKLFPVDLRPQGHEILRTWAFYTILKAYLHQNTIPWKNIMISGWCLASDKTKMSKSKGNVTTPENVMNNYGADVIRYWAATSKLGADTAYSEDVLKNGKRLVNKLWNAAKFIDQRLTASNLELNHNLRMDEVFNSLTCKMDKWLVSKCQNLIAEVTKEMHSYEYASGMQLIEEFFWRDFCDNYLEIVKVRTYNELDLDGQKSSIVALYHVFLALLRLFAPFMPYITEEIYQNIYSFMKDSIHQRFSWPVSNKIEYDLSQADGLIKVLNLVRKSKAERNLSVKAEIKLLEISGLQLSNDLVLDLQNVTAATKISFLDTKEFSANLVFTD